MCSVRQSPQLIGPLLWTLFSDEQSPYFTFVSGIAVAAPRLPLRLLLLRPLLWSFLLSRVRPRGITRIQRRTRCWSHVNCGEALESDREVVTSTDGYAIGNGAGDSLQIGDGDPLTPVGEELMIG